MIFRKMISTKFKGFFLLALLICCAMTGMGQNIVLKGEILDSTTKKPVELVNIYLLHNPGIGTVSNEDGRYLIKLEKPDTVVFSHISYRTYLYKPSFQDTADNIFLVRRPENLKEVVIKSNNQKEIQNIISNIRKYRKKNYIVRKPVYYKIFARSWDLSGTRLSEFQEYFLHMYQKLPWPPKLKIVHARAKAFTPKALNDFSNDRPYCLLGVFDDYTLIYLNDFLNVSRLNRFDCSLLRAVDIDHYSCYHIKMARKNKKETWDLFVDKKIYALVKVEFEKEGGKRYKYEDQGAVNFQQVAGKWYLKSSKESIHWDNPSNDIAKRLFVYTRINKEPLTDYKGLMKIDRIHIAKFSSGFNSDFWKNNVVVPIPKQIKAQIK